MNSISRKSSRHQEPGLEHVIEPLAGYICAAERPQAVLRSVLVALRREVERTNREADILAAALRKKPLTMPA